MVALRGGSAPPGGRRLLAAPAVARAEEPGAGRLAQSPQARPEERQGGVPREARLCLAPEGPAEPAGRRDALGAGRLEVVGEAAPPDPGAQRGRCGSRDPRQVAVHERREVDARERSRVVPQVEAGIDLEQVETTVGAALQVDLRYAAQTESLRDLPAERGHFLALRDRDRRAVAVLWRVGSQLAPRELPRDLAVRVDVYVVALNRALGAGDCLLNEHLGDRLGEPGPEGLDRVGALDVNGLRVGQRPPALPLTREWLHDDREAQAGRRRV